MSQPREENDAVIQPSKGNDAVIQPTIADKKVTRHILQAFHLRASKRLGQNFLIDAGIVRGIVDAVGIVPGERVLEIGPGIGTLTQGLAEAGAEVTAIELDKKLPAVLAKTLAGYDHVRIVQGDVLNIDLAKLMGGEAFKVAANLPYYITTPILMSLLERRIPMTRLVAMVQKEVAERMTARPGSRIYGALSVAVQYYTDPRIVLHVPPQSFIPVPEVDSAAIACEARPQPAVAVNDEKTFFRVVRAAFGQRRKTLRNALTGTGLGKESVQRALDEAGIDGNRRGEELDLCAFARIANAMG